MRQKSYTWICLFCIVFIVVAGFLTAEEKTPLSEKEKSKVLKELKPQYQDWYNTVTYISTDEERSVFLMLQNDRDRDIFIDTFWVQRDPTPGTPANEYKIEVETRFEYVNQHFKRGSSKPGWMTDMGKFYMILGKPTSIDNYDSKPGLFPAEVWYYYGDKSLGLPAYFNITFFKPNNTTEWKLYSPVSDGPEALLIHTEPQNKDDQLTLYNKIAELAPGLASPAVTMLPNEYSPGLRPSLRSNIILSNIYDSPKKKINISYANNFLKYKGFVDVDSSVNFITSSNRVSVSRNERFDFSFVNISLQPKKISVGYNNDRDKYYFNFELTVSLKQGDKFVYQYTKNFDFYIDPDKVDSLKGNGVVIHDSFPVIPGNYTLLVFARNSVGKEFTYFDQEIKVAPGGTKPLLGSPVLGYKAEPQTDNFFFPFKVGNQKLFVNTENTFRLRESPFVLVGAYNLTRELWEGGRVEIRLNNLSDRVKFDKTYSIQLKDHPFHENMNILYRLTEEGLAPDYYELNLKLVNKLGIAFDSKGCDFTVSPSKELAYPMEAYKTSRLDNPYIFYYIVATQYESIDDLENAGKYFTRCLENNPDFYEGQVKWLTLLNRQKKFTQVLVEVEKLKKSEKHLFDFHLIKGTALLGMQDYPNALTELVKANEIYDSDIRVLNLLGYTFLNLNDIPEALKAFNASLNLNKSQPQIVQTVKQIKERAGIKE